WRGHQEHWLEAVRPGAAGYPVAPLGDDFVHARDQVERGLAVALQPVVAHAVERALDRPGLARLFAGQGREGLLGAPRARGATGLAVAIAARSTGEPVPRIGGAGVEHRLQPCHEVAVPRPGDAAPATFAQLLHAKAHRLAIVAGIAADLRQLAVRIDLHGGGVELGLARLR